MFGPVYQIYTKTKQDNQQMTQKKLFICGDSYMSASVHTPKKHFSELIANNLDFKLHSIARGGMSNGGICMQIEYAIGQNADLVLIGTSHVDRIEFIAQDSDSQSIDCTNILYRHKNYLSAQAESVMAANKLPSVISDNLISLLDDNDVFNSLYDDIPDMDKKKKAIKQYYLHLYNYALKHKQDEQCLYASIHKLHLSRIPYIVVFDPEQLVCNIPWLANSAFTPIAIPAIADHFIKEFNKVSEIKYVDPGYHTLPETQQTIAQMILTYIETTRIV